MIVCSRLKLIPDVRRSQNSSVLTGMGTIIVNQEFRFTVSMPIKSAIEPQLCATGAALTAGKQNSEWDYSG